MLRSRSTLFALPVLLAPVTGFTETEADVLTLDTILVSGGLTPLAAESYARSHTILQADEMAEQGATSVEDALRQVPGLSVTSTGDSLTKLRIRGSEHSHVLVLIDGVEANSPADGAYVFSGMDLANIDRIEVLRGPQAVIHGPNAAAGVIVITTGDADKPGLSYGGRLEVGGQASYAASTYLHHQGTQGRLSLSLAARNIGGEDQSRSGGGRDFNDTRSVTLSGDRAFGATVKAGFTLRRSWQEYGYDANAPGPVSDPRDYVVDAPLVADRDEVQASAWIEAEALDGRYLGRLHISGMRQDTDHFNDGQAEWNDKASRRKLRYTGVFALDGLTAEDSDRKLIFAAETARESYRSTYNPGGTYKRDTHALAIEYHGRFDGGISVQAGVRRDFNDHFRDATAWNIAAAWQPDGQDFRLRASAGQAQVNPDMFQQYGYIPGVYRGNPDLRPEQNRNYEIGADLDFASGAGQARLTLFHSKISDMITGTAESSTNMPGTSTRKGFEIGANYAANDWLTIEADYTHVIARAEDGRPIPRAPRHQLGLRASAAFADGQGRISAEYRHVSGNYDEEWYTWDANPAISKLPSVNLVNLAAHYDLSDEIRLQARIINLFDKDYSEAWGYYGPGRTAYIGLSARW